MPYKKKSSNKSGLGRRLIKEQSSRFTHQPAKSNERHTVDLNEGEDWAKLNVRSITEETTLQEFLSTAQLAGTDFKAEHENVKLVNPLRSRENDAEQQVAVARYIEDHASVLCLPRRPPWDSDTTPEELREREYQSFLEWRRQLAHLEENENAILTPFERNLEFWRQLWRVIERSDAVAQIVDARNPLLFFSDDLIKYAAEVDKRKISLVIVNKADYLTEDQRAAWANYFDEHKLKVVFFSALEEMAAKNEEEESVDSDENENSEDEADEDGSTTDGDEEVTAHEDDSDSVPGEDESVTEDMKDLNLTSQIVNSGRLLTRLELVEYFKSLRQGWPKERRKESITVGLIGYPNVGKSSTINAILQCKKVSVSTTPGKTKHFQTLVIDDELTLCDCPGLVFPKLVTSRAEMLINGILPVDQMTQYLPAVNLLVSLVPKHIFESVYSLVLPQTNGEPYKAEDLLNAYGLMRGYMTHRGLPDGARAARYILKDFVAGRIVYCVAPPNVDQASYLSFPPESAVHKKNQNRAAPHHKFFAADKLTEEDFNLSYFAESSGGAHVKGKGGVAAYTRYFNGTGDPKEVQCVLSRPKKHGNRKKREKLRRVYRHLDTK